MSAMVRANIERVVKPIEACRECAWILPEVGTNIAMALPGAKDLAEVAELTGRIIRIEDRAFSEECGLMDGSAFQSLRMPLGGPCPLSDY